LVSEDGSDRIIYSPRLELRKKTCGMPLFYGHGAFLSLKTVTDIFEECLEVFERSLEIVNLFR